MFCRAALMICALSLEACGSSASHGAQASQDANALAEKREEERSMADLKRTNDQLKAEIEALKIERSNNVKTSGSLPAPAPAPVAVQAMCYKDYCPCEGQQGGPDMTLCDQLEQGIDVDIRLMIAGRSMREVRRQLDTGDY